MAHAKNIAGQRFHRLLVIDRAHNFVTSGGFSIVQWNCVCDCGAFVVVSASNLSGGNTKSCGCWRSDFERANKTHGKSSSRTYNIWNAMIQRCNNKNNISYPNYGGRGIYVSHQWLKFDAFLQDMGEAPDKHSIDRINNDLGYSKSNCKWSRRDEQANNTRRNRLITIDGNQMTAAQWGEKFDIDMKVILNRIDALGWNHKDAVTKPIRRQRTKSPCT